ncbi:MAG: hypothetical protein AAF517_19900 [Planctomycetota bacterium]
MIDRWNRRRSAFTFLELMLAIGIGSGLLFGVLVFYEQASRIRREVEVDVLGTNDARLLMSKVARELQCAIDDWALGKRLEGTSNSIQFLTTTVPQPASWFLDANGEIAAPQTGLRRVSYRLRREPSALTAAPDEQTFVSNPIEETKKEPAPGPVVGIERGEQVLVSALRSEDPGVVLEELATDRLKHLRFEYYDGHHWHQEWRHGHLPRAVQITFGFEPLEEGVHPRDYPHREIVRMVAIYHGIDLGVRKAPKREEGKR